MQGNCSEPVSSEVLNVGGVASLHTLKPGQCAILTEMALGHVSEDMWFHNLYIRHHQTLRNKHVGIVLWCDTPDCRMWLADVTVQGDGFEDPYFGGLQVSGGELYADGAPQILQLLSCVTCT